MQLALFDLDHTLIPFDSGMAWTEWLAAQGVLPADAPQRHLNLCREYVAGRQDIRGLHRATAGPISHLEPAELARLAQGFAAGGCHPGCPPHPTRWWPVTVTPATTACW
jgi:phosphoserine phosphatase